MEPTVISVAVFRAIALGPANAIAVRLSQRPRIGVVRLIFTIGVVPLVYNVPARRIVILVRIVVFRWIANRATRKGTAVTHGIVFGQIAVELVAVRFKVWISCVGIKARDKRFYRCTKFALIEVIGNGQHDAYAICREGNFQTLHVSCSLVWPVTAFSG
jgi:hypothetical protein